jgi:hyperosmotically inducible periplasmic protein
VKDARSRAAGALQKETAAEREIARKSRQAIVQDKSLSTSAHNVRVMVRDGESLLKGTVRKQDEKTSIRTKANNIAEAHKVQNDLAIKS